MSHLGETTTASATMNVRTTSKEPCSSSVGSPHETNPNVETVLPLAEVVGLLQEGVGGI